MLTMIPGPGSHLLQFCGDRVTFILDAGSVTGPGLRALLRTNLGRGVRLREEVVASLGGQGEFAGQSWRDVPMRQLDGRWVVDLPLTDIGHFRAKPYLVDDRGIQTWPTGDDVGISIHPDSCRTANLIYCAFPRMFGASKFLASTRDPLRDEQVAIFDQHGWTVIPPSGTLRDLLRELPHICGRLGCTILHLLPVSPTPTTYARYGRFGSPYACTDLTAIDPALVEFDKKTTAVDQFRELTAGAHARHCRVFLDIVINHTGWGSTLMDQHPEWFKRDADGKFHSPGAWGNTWEDLVELDQRHVELWEEIARSLLVWCDRGVDGFRCDAGYMVPLPAWQYIIARVRQHHPEAVFLLEGLGGSWEATSGLMTDGGMQWAYSELFQNYSAGELTSYLDHCHGHAAQRGVLIHYSETHDNDRLAKQGRAWARMRSRLSALVSHCGGYGFTAGVEWLATEKLEVHQSRGMRWGNPDNLVPDLAALNLLLAEHPCFFDEASVTRISPTGSPVWACRRQTADQALLILVNPDRLQPQILDLPAHTVLGITQEETTGDALPGIEVTAQGGWRIHLPPLACVCLGAPAIPGSGTAYRRDRAVAAFAYGCLARHLDDHATGPVAWRDLAAWVAEDPVRFLAGCVRLDAREAAADLLGALKAGAARGGLPPVCPWSTADTNRTVCVPPGHWLVAHDDQPFRLVWRRGAVVVNLRSIQVQAGHIAALPPQDDGDSTVELVHLGGKALGGPVLHLPARPLGHPARTDLTGTVLLTNGRGGMSRLAVDLGQIRSKYDALMAANLHPTAPCDRHVLAKRVRVWIDADGFITPLDRHNLVRFEAGPPAVWRFLANAGDGRTVAVTLTADMLQDRNTVILRFSRDSGPAAWGTPLPANARVHLTVRIDLEDRSFHSETRLNEGALQHFQQHTAPLTDRPGFRFTPSPDRRFTCWMDAGIYHSGPEALKAIPHPLEVERGMAGSGDAWSPGWFAVPLAPGHQANLICDGEADQTEPQRVAEFIGERQDALTAAVAKAGLAEEDAFGQTLATGCQAFVVRRGAGKSVIAGYPWFLDWGRDTFIAARGLLAAGMTDEVLHILTTFGRFEDVGTLPNLLNGDKAENRDTSDAPLWFAVVCEDAANKMGDQIWDLPVDERRTLRHVVHDIASGYLKGTANGIRVDPVSGLVWSPPHFTWMDTNYPACTPRQGYPIEIQALWLRLLRCLDRQGGTAAAPWGHLADLATASLSRFWLPEKGWFADCLDAAPGVPAAGATVDPALRPNQLFAITLGAVTGDQARRAVSACARYLVVPGALRSLAPLPAEVPHPILAAHGGILGDPMHPYRGRYLGDEDTQRKPAYHNGTGWTMPFPSFCEALALAWDEQPDAVAAARAHLIGMERLLNQGCPGQLPENCDGDTPHAQRGCDAQAWGITEALRVWKKLGG